MYAQAHLELLLAHAARNLVLQDLRAIQDAESEGWPILAPDPAPLRPATPWRHYFTDRDRREPLPDKGSRGLRRRLAAARAGAE